MTFISKNTNNSLVRTKMNLEWNVLKEMALKQMELNVTVIIKN